MDRTPLKLADQPFYKVEGTNIATCQLGTIKFFYVSNAIVSVENIFIRVSHTQFKILIIILIDYHLSKRTVVFFT